MDPIVIGIAAAAAVVPLASTEVRIAETLAHRSDAFGSLQRATGKRVDMDAVEREIDDRLRALSELIRSGTGSGSGSEG